MAWDGGFRSGDVIFAVNGQAIGSLIEIRTLAESLQPGDPVVADKTVLATFQPQTPTLLDARSRAEAEAGARAARATLERARADRDRAEAELEFADAEVERFRRLAADRIVHYEHFTADW